MWRGELVRAVPTARTHSKRKERPELANPEHVPVLPHHLGPDDLPYSPDQRIHIRFRIEVPNGRTNEPSIRSTDRLMGQRAAMQA